MLKILFYGFISITLFSTSLFFFAIVGHLGATEVLPGIRNGRFDVDTSIMILNVVWEGNEIYVLLTAYLLLAVGFAYASIRVFKKASRK